MPDSDGPEAAQRGAGRLEWSDTFKLECDIAGDSVVCDIWNANGQHKSVEAAGLRLDADATLAVDPAPLPASRSMTVDFEAVDCVRDGGAMDGELFCGFPAKL